MQNWSVLYTHHKTQKSKKWVEGLLKFNVANQKVMLYTEDGKAVVDSMFLSKGSVTINRPVCAGWTSLVDFKIPFIFVFEGTVIENGAELELERHLVQVEELQVASNPNDSNTTNTAHKQSQPSAAPTTTISTSANNRSHNSSTPAIRPPVIPSNTVKAQEATPVAAGTTSSSPTTSSKQPLRRRRTFDTQLQPKNFTYEPGVLPVTMRKKQKKKPGEDDEDEEEEQSDNDIKQVKQHHKVVKPPPQRKAPWTHQSLDDDENEEEEGDDGHIKNEGNQAPTTSNRPSFSFASLIAAEVKTQAPVITSRATPTIITNTCGGAGPKHVRNGK